MSGRGAGRGWVRRVSASLAGAALLISVVTVFARVAGFGRTLVFSQTVGENCLGTAYVTANQLPTVLFEVVIGGALSGMVVPVLATAASRGDAGQVRRTASALVTWVVLAAVPLSLLLAAASAPAALLLLSGTRGCDSADLLALATRFLVVFAPQILFYGLAAVLYGVLQAHRRFLAPALAPLVSSLVVIAAYVAFVPLSGGRADDIGALPAAAELTLSLGTTAGVAALFLTALVPVARLRLGLRPTLSFPPGIARRARSLAVAALLPLVAMQLSLLLSMWLANNGGGGGTGVLYSYAWALFTLPYGIVAVPIATSAFTALSVHHGEREQGAFDRVLSTGVRACLIATAGPAAALAAAAFPLSLVFAGETAPQLARALPAYAPGIVAFGTAALLSRALYASHHGRAAALAQVAGWLAVTVGSVAGVALAPPGWTVAALGAGTSLGLGIGALLLVAAVLRARGRSAFAAAGRTVAACALGTGLGYACGAGVAALAPTGSTPAAAGAAVLSGTAALAGYGLAVALIDSKALRAALTRRIGGASTDEGRTG
ncbi:murein biosynthesis integral membrane protein MurJ [Actinorugispora endophytica]|uniref:Putative peptidoglycan lipid II flippase n=1 Tax=Actinorugispora endophytica TaxID=1605990 RepID=A0A4R6UKN5_9ACTN|nr:lipid II flippase MurJ [Actinorugispora endophytica]TDQ47550.1 putative peptidoglycan lipid II flippase [Actinorugispora endophytica]